MQRDRYIMALTIESASGLEPMDRGGTSDPYVKIKVGKQRDKTEVKKKTLDPVWAQSFSFEGVTSTDTVKLSVWDKDQLVDEREGEVILGTVEVRTLIR